MLTTTPWGPVQRSLDAVSVRSDANICSCDRKDQARSEARRLRSELGWSLARIARELGVAKSSVSVWVRGLEPTRRREPPKRPRRAPFRRDACACGSPASCGAAVGAATNSPSNASTVTRDGLQWWCRILLRRVLPRARRHAPSTVVAPPSWRDSEPCKRSVLDHLRHHPCVDCGEADPVVLEFDHLGEKTASVAELVSRTASVTAVDAEIAGCEVVCANCHRRRTATRGRWRRAATANVSARPYANPNVARNFAHILDVLRRRPCVDCESETPLSSSSTTSGPSAQR